ncbi:hypothetical protein ERHA54_06140 [Erwinia rhapontici]|uniref:hypothetical protein n=1 Tax=Erwinia rhapontici TaxID=55212 RepID=UPI001BB44190|nr:hypothetical protein [Erwinia rhapontici]BCQ38011.1 hypothetical protein ERHA54_06140 [Erwinia rhapontici]
MITFNIGNRTFPLTPDEAVYVAENLLAAAKGKAGIIPAFSSGAHGHICVRTASQKSDAKNSGDKKETFRSNPQQPDSLLTDC